MTLRDILAEIKRSLKEPASGVGHWTDSELLRRVNIGQRKIVRYTDCLQAKTNINSISGEPNYNKPANFLKIIRVYYGKNRLFGVPVADLDIWSAEMRGQVWQDIVGNPTHYIEYPDKITLYPKPISSGDSISIEYVVKPNDLVYVDETPFNGVSYLEDYHDLIVSFVLWRCLLEDGNQLYAEHKNDFLQGVAHLRAEMKGRPDIISSFDLIRPSRINRKPIPFA